MENMKFCQSCGMPMEEESLYGKNYDGSKNEDYCCYCYPSGFFNNPHETMEEMIESCIPHMITSEENPTEFPDAETARKVMQKHLPTLKRWKPACMLVTFKLKEDTSTEEFLAASDDIQKNYLSTCAGFITRQLMVADNVWTDWIIWKNPGAAQTAMMNSESNESAVKFMSMCGEVMENSLYPLERSY